MSKKVLHIITAFLLVLPLLVIVYLSLVYRWAGQNLVPESFTFDYWKDLFTLNSDLGSSFLLSLFISSCVALFSTTFGFLISKQLAFENKKWIKLAYFPYLIAPVVFGTMLQFYFNRFNLSGNIGGVLIAQLLFIFPYSILLLSTFWNDRIKQMAFQASTLGANNLELYRKVLVPMAKPWLFICFVQCFLISWYEYGITHLIGVGKVKTLTVQAMLFVKEANPFLAGLASCLMVFPVIILLVANKRIFLRRTEFL
ncbi:MAG: hypothetical protein R2879_00280 [Saprospiraceae bacterium]